MRRQHSGRPSRVGRWRKRTHEWRGHRVVRTTMRDMSDHAGQYEFYFRRAWQCVQCQNVWGA